MIEDALTRYVSDLGKEGHTVTVTVWDLAAAHQNTASKLKNYLIGLDGLDGAVFIGTCRDDRVHLSPAGEVVQRRWEAIPAHRPAIETNTLVVMPDHLHGIVYVRETLPKPVGLTIRGYKSGVTAELRRLLAPPAMAVWEAGYHDRVMMCSDT